MFGYRISDSKGWDAIGVSYCVSAETLIPIREGEDYCHSDNISQLLDDWANSSKVELGTTVAGPVQGWFCIVVNICQGGTIRKVVRDERRRLTPSSHCNLALSSVLPKLRQISKSICQYTLPLTPVFCRNRGYRPERSASTVQCFFICARIFPKGMDLHETYDDTWSRMIRHVVHLCTISDVLLQTIHLCLRRIYPSSLVSYRKGGKSFGLCSNVHQPQCAISMIY